VEEMLYNCGAAVLIGLLLLILKKRSEQ